MLTAEAGLPTRASASVTVITVTGTTRLNAASPPKREKILRRDIISDLGFSLIIASCLIAKSRHKTTVNFDEDQNMPRLIEQRYPLECRCGSKTRHAGNLRSIAKMAREGRSAASRCRRLRPWCSRGGAAAGSVFGFAPCFVVEIGGICRFAGMRNNGSVGLLPPPSSKRTRVSRQALRCTSVTLGRRGW